MAIIKALIVDDHSVVRNGVRYILEREKGIEVVGEASDGREAVRLAQALSPDVIVMAMLMPNPNGIEAATQIIKRSPKTAIIILSMFSDESYITRALSAGVRG